MAKKALLSFFGGTGDPTGSNFLFQTEEATILIDCGFFQGCKVCEDENRKPFPYDPKEIDALFITHSHIDHIGRIPTLVKNGFQGKIYSTPPTKELAKVMLEDSLGVLSKEAKRDHLPLIYEMNDVERSFQLWETLAYHEEVPVKDVIVQFHDAGHILGSAMAQVSYGEKKMLFTGDLGNSPAPLLPDTEIPHDINYLLMESTYGDRDHEKKEMRKELLEDVIEETVKRGGTLMVPAFSLERTQELLYEINDLVEHGRIPKIPVFLDSPLAIKVTDIYKHNSKYFNIKTRDVIQSGDDIFNFPLLKQTLRTEESKAILEVAPPKVIIAGSGMSNGGRIIHHERAYLPDPKSTLLLIGYQAPGTLGRILQDGATSVKIFGEEVAVRARIATIHGYSAHKDATGLYEFVNAMSDTLEKVFVVMGETKSSLFLTQRLRDYLGVNATAPERGEQIELEF